ncbi:MAG: CDP-diacylglycerol--glycerol-3-phosphate 3-phosphatidyltransferase [Bacteroidota bacterium]
MALPDRLTVLRIILSPVFVILFLNDTPEVKIISLFVFLIAAITDWYDGWAARHYGYFSRWGKFLDPLADKILTSAALIAFTRIGLIDAWMVWIIILRDFLITLLRSYAEYKGKPVVTSFTAKTKTVGQYISIYYILLLYVGKFIPSVYERFSMEIENLLHPQVLFGMMIVVTAATAWTGVVYIVENRKTLMEIL